MESSLYLVGAVLVAYSQWGGMALVSYDGGEGASKHGGHGSQRVRLQHLFSVSGHAEQDLSQWVQINGLG